MIRGIYTSVSGLAAADKRQQILASSVANANTPGYKSDDITNESFDKIFTSIFDPAPGTGVETAGHKIDLSQGSLKQTGGPLDAALDGPGFFVLDGPDGPLYTRAGRFSRDNAGVLRSTDGHIVQGVDGQPITATGTDVRILQDGTVTNDGAIAGRLRLVDLDQASLSRAGTATFSSTAAPTRSTAKVVSGALEDSNVDVTAVMTSTTMLLRAFEAGRQALQTQNDTLGAAVNQVGTIR
jgi:flagellar basal-body rod protein FlgG